MNSTDKFKFLRQHITNNAILNFLAKCGVDTRELLRRYGGINCVPTNEVEVDFAVVSSYVTKYYQTISDQLTKHRQFEERRTQRQKEFDNQA